MNEKQTETDEDESSYESDNECGVTEKVIKGDKRCLKLLFVIRFLKISKYC